ncbi:hypothetical protein NAT51_05565 [Flavobacterium amniphilum]|uniref:hypothetical protein n=1 Tax=Flavobacterium amniphilum TaxID=1834035 RepID=UPI00202AA9DF|nr:hypothetical protein [Flavobacterium amniphilum]MCL9804975.1 hypothetical protein [Flavobacterium amniphilum]
MGKIYAILTVVLGITVSNAQEVRKVSGFNHIESVANDGTFLYVGDIGTALKPKNKDGDGKILKLDKNGKVVDANFIKEILNAPKGLTVDGDVLFATDIDRLLAFDLKTGNKLYEIEFNGASFFLNDIAVFDKNTLYVSATDKNKLFKVNLVDKTFVEVVMDKEVAGINGLYVDKKASRLYVNGFGTEGNPNGIVGYINFDNNKFTQITPIEGYYDGMVAYDGVLYFSNWIAFEKKGIIATMSLADNKVSSIKLSELISGPADFTVFRNQLVVPGMMDGTLNFISIQRESLYIH